MIYTDLTKKAMRIAYDAHREQVDKAGLPYIFHPAHLAEQMETEDEACAALLHDVIEDTGVTLDELRTHGFPESVVSAIALLTHDDATEYMDYIAKIKLDPIARKVKLADLRHNSNRERLGQPNKESQQRQLKYRKAIMMLHGFPARESDAEPLKRERVPLDRNKLWFLSVFRDKSENIIKYSFDVEKAGDSHYLLPAEEYGRLAAYLGCGDTIDLLRRWIAEHSKSDFERLLDRLEIFYQPFHFD